MNLIGTKEIETQRLLLKIPTMKEQKLLWEILMIPEVNKYYLTVNKIFRERLQSWEKQEPFYNGKIDSALEKDKFEWSIFLKETGVCIGQINAHNREDLSKDIKDVGWYINPQYQGKGYGSEAAKAMLDYMFYEVQISGVNTGAAITNSSSWMIMEKLGLKRTNKINYVNYTFGDEPIEAYEYKITKEEYINNINSDNANQKL